ncbi:MAG TPA: phenylalanine--tRNA ligase subunit alpha [Candidatus Saccharimonadia bacterium]|nr:phenylalanine--tRNA ligase subunit alpha [Candidatus Saccharimonadia bacterium]
MNKDIEKVSSILFSKLEKFENKSDILKAKELKDLYALIPTLPENKRSSYGRAVNDLVSKLKDLANAHSAKIDRPKPIDVTAPMDLNQNLTNNFRLFPANQGSVHPLMMELYRVLDIFYRMGFSAEESRQIDDDYNMFEALNFPKDHPARDDYDTFMTEDGFIAPAHTSTMQNRILRKYKKNLGNDEPISVVIPGMVFRNEDVDARHDHTFYQVEGIYVNTGVNAGNLIQTLRTFLEEYYEQNLEIKTQPFYFPFTEPSFEFALSCPFCKKKGCSICSQSGWIELLGCGMIHPKVLEHAGINPKLYSGFAFGFGLDRLAMMKYDIEDVRQFKASKLEFLRQFV